MNASDREEPAGLTRGDHGCCLYRGQEELRAVTGDFVRRGIEAGARLLWLWDRHAPREIESGLRSRGIETGTHLAEGRLQLRSVDESLVRQGRFRPPEALAWVREQVDRTLEDGYEALHIILETGALAARLDDAAPLLRFEQEMGGVVADRPCAALCLYSLDEVPSGIVLEALDAHSLVILEGRIHTTNGAAARRRGAADTDRLLRDRLRRMAAPPEPAPTAKTGSEELLPLLGALAAAAESATEDEVLTSALAEICRRTGWPIGHVWVPNEGEEYLHSSGIWQMSDPEKFGRLREATRAVRFHRGMGLPGRAWVTGRPVTVADLGPDQGFFQSRGQELLGIRSAFGVPIRFGDRVLGVVELSSSESIDPDERLLSMMAHMGSRLGEILQMKRMEQTLRSYETRFRALEEASSGAVVVTDGSGQILSWSPGAQRLFGRASEEVVGTPLSLLIPDWPRKADEAVLEGYLTTGEARVQGRTMTLEGVALDGTPLPIELSLTSWESEGTRYFGNVVRAGSGKPQVQEPQEELLGVPSGWKVREAVVVTTGRSGGEGGAIRYVNSAFTELTGYEETEVVGREIEDLLAGPDTDPKVLERIREALEGQVSFAEEVTAYRKDGSPFQMAWSLAPVRGDPGGMAHFVHIQADVGRERQARDALRRAEADALTGLADRSVILQRIQRCIERRQSRPDYQFALLFLDLDNFKEVNDSLGHIVGDQVLTAVARRLERSVRPGDTIARYGGDEFVILLEFILGMEDVITVAERIRSEIVLPFTFQGRDVAISASIGIALSETGYSTPVRMLEDADAAMYRAKQDGPAGYRIYDEQLHNEALSVLRMEAELLRSVRESAFLLQYQPMVELATGRIVGFEALLRWRHPDRGFLSPDHFISLAETTGLIVSIGEWVLREACRQAHEWQAESKHDPPLLLSVNVSGRELSDPGFASRLEEILSETGMEPRHLQLEISEVVLTEEPEGLEETLRAIRSMGVLTCIDDFGTGYSSLVHVHRHSLDTLKIDRILVGGLGSAATGDEAREGDMAGAILSLARNLGMRSIAEGVESQSQLDRLLELGCEVGQGFLFSEPVDGERAAALLRGSPIKPSNDNPADLPAWK